MRAPSPTHISPWLNYLEFPDGWAWSFCYDLFDDAIQTKMKSKNVTEIYSQLAKKTFLEQDRTSNFPSENIKAWEEYCEASLDLSNQDEDIQMTKGNFLKNYPEVTRVEVINGSERELVRYECSNVQVSLQDDGQTIKVFLFSTYDWRTN